jgi:translocation and assembly module TamB
LAAGRAQAATNAELDRPKEAQQPPLVNGGRRSRLRKRLTGRALLAAPLSVEVKASGDHNGIALSNLVVRSGGASVVGINGFVPLTFNPAAATNSLNLVEKKSLQLSASVEPQALVWDQLEDWTGIFLQDPALRLTLSGTWAELHGEIDFSAQKIEPEDALSVMPSLENLGVKVQLGREVARLTEAKILVQGQPVSLTGEIPLGRDFWSGLREKKLPDWQQATARLRVENAKIAAFEPLFPQFVAPQGEVDLDLALERGAKLSGTLTVQHARTRPLGEFGPIRDINLNMRFRERMLELEQASAKISGAEVSLSGGVDFRGTNWLDGELPPFEISVRGTEVPLARKPEFIVRSDLLLGIIKTNNAPPLISGVAHMRDSFYLSDLSALVPGKVSTPSARPPYFSIDQPGLADWRLALVVDGSRFLQIRSSVFNGEVSANLHLQGTLKDPIALGTLKIDSGVVRFPFANLQLHQGLVNLTSQNPYHPQLLVSATSKQFGYDIRMEVSGTADAPIVQFSSNPPLSSEQIVLLVTSGQMPQGAYTLTAQQRAQTVALFLGRDLLSKLGFGDQSEQRLTIRSGEQISEQGKPTYYLEYKLTDRWAVTGEYDRFGDYNAGFKWRIYSR